MKQSRVRAALAVSLALAAVLTVPPESEAGYGNGQAMEAQLTNTVAVGGVKGRVGVLSDMQSSGGGTQLATAGVVGVLWKNQELNHKDGGPGTGGADAFHVYDWTDFGTSTLSMNTTAIASVSGSANRLNPGSWWWDSTNHVISDDPTATAYVPGTGYVDLAFDYSIFQFCNAYGGDAGDQHAQPPTNNTDHSTTPPSSVSGWYNAPHQPVVNGVIRATVQLPDEPGAYVTVQASWGAEAEGCVDNAVVNNDKCAMDVTLSTSVN